VEALNGANGSGGDDNHKYGDVENNDFAHRFTEFVNNSEFNDDIDERNMRGEESEGYEQDKKVGSVGKEHRPPLRK